MSAWIRLLDRHPLVHAVGLAAIGLVVATGGGTRLSAIPILIGLAVAAVVIMWFRNVVMPAAMRSLNGSGDGQPD